MVYGLCGEEMIKSEIFVPLLNANEPEARLVQIHVKDRQAVEKGLRLFTIETTKATSDIESPDEGFVRVLAIEGAMLSVGDRLGAITDSANEEINLSSKSGLLPLPVKELRITKPARALADLLGVDLPRKGGRERCPAYAASASLPSSISSSPAICLAHIAA